MGMQACQYESLQYLGDSREVEDGPVYYPVMNYRVLLSSAMASFEFVYGW